MSVTAGNDPPVGAALQQNPDLANLVGVVGVKLPPFWKGDPIVWFAQAEAQFKTRNIIVEDTKFAHIVAALQPEVAQEVRDILISPPADKPYSVLRDQLIQRTSASEQRRVQLLLTEEELGDRRPSQLLRRMTQLAGAQQLDSGILRQLFLQRLPANVRLILASASTKTSLEDLAELADRIIEVNVPMISPVSAPTESVSACAPQPKTSDNAALREEISNLTKLVTRLQTQVTKLARSNSASRSRSRTRSEQSATSREGEPPRSHEEQLCWYHDKWGDKARYCRAPCDRATFTTPSENA